MFEFYEIGRKEGQLAGFIAGLIVGALLGAIAILLIFAIYA